MASGAERPPSQQGIEYRTLDAVEELRRKVEELAQRPALPHPNWWDVLPMLERPDGRRDSLAGRVQDGTVQQCAIPTRHPSEFLNLRVGVYPDRIELSLQMNGGWVLWQRALFYERPFAPIAA